MMRLVLAGGLFLASATATLADTLFWVVGNNATNSCEIVTSNPVITGPVGGDVTFGSGPYRSKDDAKLARSTIRQCPPEPPEQEPDKAED